jgi:hypothetical protein
VGHDQDTAAPGCDGLTFFGRDLFQAQIAAFHVDIRLSELQKSSGP